MSGEALYEENGQMLPLGLLGALGALEGMAAARDRVQPHVPTSGMGTSTTSGEIIS